MKPITGKGTHMTLMTAEDRAMANDEAAPRVLADLRRAAGLSLEQVAERMGITKGRVNQIEARYPSVNYGTLLNYMQAIGAGIQFTVGTTHAFADQLIPDPSKAGTRKYLADPGRRGGQLVYVPSRSAEELPLQDGTSESGGDDTGRNVDEPDTESDQSDSGQSQQP
jgi:transcriptional regulator with XRE-family HTH domain